MDAAVSLNGDAYETPCVHAEPEIRRPMQQSSRRTPAVCSSHRRGRRRGRDQATCGAHACGVKAHLPILALPLRAPPRRCPSQVLWGYSATRASSGAAYACAARRMELSPPSSSPERIPAEICCRIAADGEGMCNGGEWTARQRIRMKASGQGIRVHLSGASNRPSNPVLVEASITT